jgi:hypothetical protein
MASHSELSVSERSEGYEREGTRDDVPPKFSMGKILSKLGSADPEREIHILLAYRCSYEPSSRASHSEAVRRTMGKILSKRGSADPEREIHSLPAYRCSYEPSSRASHSEAVRRTMGKILSKRGSADPEREIHSLPAYRCSYEPSSVVHWVPLSNSFFIEQKSIELLYLTPPAQCKTLPGHSWHLARG